MPPFAHPHFLAILHEFNQLHEHHIQFFAIQPDGIHGALHPGHVAVVVGAPHINAPGKAPVEFVFVVGNIGCHIGGSAILANQHFVLGGVFFADFSFFVLLHVLFGEGGSFIPGGAVLFVNQAVFLQGFNHVANSPTFMQGSFAEPFIIFHAVFGHIPLHFGNVLGQGKRHQRAAAFLFRHVHESVAVLIRIGFGKVQNVFAVVTVFGQFGRVVAHK